MGLQRPADDDGIRLDDLRGSIVVVQPKSELHGVKTRFGERDAWVCDVYQYVSETKGFNEFLGVNIYTGSIRRDCASAQKNGNVLIGRLVQRGQGMRLEDLSDEEFRIMDQAWSTKTVQVGSEEPF